MCHHDSTPQVASILTPKPQYKVANSKAFVQRIMLKTLHLPAVTVSGQSLSPVFICATSNVAQLYKFDFDPWTRCQAPDDSAPTSFWVENSAVIIICPRFEQQLKPQPVFSPGGPTDVYCPLVRGNMFVGKSFPLVRYQCYDLVRQIVKLYLQGIGLGPATEPREAIDWNECVALGYEGQSLSPSERNAMNVVYYAACESSLTYLFEV